MSGYKVEKQAEGFWRINDPKNDAMYLIEGEERALLIDTGMSDEPLLPVLKTLTDKRIDLALTHAHIDHMYRCAEFSTVYLHENDIDDWGKGLGRTMLLGEPLFKVRHKKYNVHSFMPLYDDSEIDLGGLTIRIVRLSGHTKGSVLFIDDRHKAVLCGDAVGSGTGVWMFLPYCTDISTYHNELVRAEKSLADAADYTYYGGHIEQDCGKYAFPLSYETVSDMRVLCEKVLNGTVKPERIKQIPVLPVLYCRNGKAAMVTRKGKIK